MYIIFATATCGWYFHLSDFECTHLEKSRKNKHLLNSQHIREIDIYESF